MRLPLPLVVAHRFWRHERNKLRGAALAGATLLLRVHARKTPLTLTMSTGRGEARVKVWDYIDMLVAREVFLDGDYRLPNGFEPQTILDLGSNIGVSVRYFLATSRATIVAVEADFRLLPKLRENADGEPRVTVVAAAVATERGPIQFYSAPEGWASSLYPQQDAVSTTVDGLTVKDILARADLERVDLVKLDIEGAEWPLLEQGQIQAVTDCIVGELHHESGHTLESARELLSAFDVAVHDHDGARTLFTAYRR